MNRTYHRGDDFDPRKNTLATPTALPFARRQACDQRPRLLGRERESGSRGEKRETRDLDAVAGGVAVDVDPYDLVGDGQEERPAVAAAKLELAEDRLDGVGGPLPGHLGRNQRNLVAGADGAEHGRDQVGSSVEVGARHGYRFPFARAAA